MELNRQNIAATALFLAAWLSAARADNYVVTNTNSSGPGSLAQAILDSNARSGQDIIAFQVPGSGIHLIDLSQTSLPEITDSVILDGYSQPGAHPNTLSIGSDAVILIQLDGGSVPVQRNGSGLIISGSNCVIRGLSITGCLSGSDLFQSAGRGILFYAGNGNVIEGNFIGVNPDGVTARGNFIGVDVVGGSSIIGGADPAARNVISGNGVGIQIERPGTLVQGNYIGTDATGTRAVGNGDGILVGASDAVVGGTAPGSGNLISGNTSAGISLGGEVGPHVTGYADRSLVQGNFIGTKADGVGPLGNGLGVSIFRSSNCTIGGLDPGAGNVIAFDDIGVGVDETGHRILSNSIYGHSNRGILLYTDSANHLANNGQSAPVITAEDVSNGIASVSGTLKSAPNTQFLLQFFADSQSLTAPKQTYLISKNVTTDGNGNVSFAARFPFADSYVVFNATATDPDGNTSEFFRHPALLQNLSARAAVGTGDNALIGGLLMEYGFVTLRGIGPSLKSFGLTNALADPTLEVHDQTGAQIFNDNWKDDQSQVTPIQQSGLAPANDAESVVLPFGGSNPFQPKLGGFAPYTAVLRGKGDTTGIGVVEAYTSGGFNSNLANISARGFVGTGDNVIIGGFIVGDGNESPRIVVRAIGPSLKTAAVANPLADPVVELHDGNGLLITTNDNWTDVQKDDLQTVGLAPTDNAESAILTRLAAGTYTAIVRGKNNATGVALVEVYNLR
jgi:hypothetical protein